MKLSQNELNELPTHAGKYYLMCCENRVNDHEYPSLLMARRGSVVFQVRGWAGLWIAYAVHDNFLEEVESIDIPD